MAEIKADRNYLDAIELFDKEKYQSAFFSILTYLINDNFKDASEEVKTRSYLILGGAAAKLNKKDVVWPLISTLRSLRG